MTATADTRGEALDGERFLVQVAGETRDEDGQLRALHRAIVACYADCHHAVLPVTADYRAALTYHLFLEAIHRQVADGSGPRAD